MVPNQTGLNEGLSSNLCWLRRANHSKFTEECMICKEKNVLVLKNLYEWTKLSFATMSLSRKGWKPSFSGKEKITGATVSKEGHADNLLGHER